MAAANNNNHDSYDGDYLTSSIAVYSLNVFSSTALDEALSIINHDIEAFTPARLAPEPHTPSQSIETLMAKHAQLAANQERSGEDHEYHPTMFLVLASDKKPSKTGTCLAISNDYDGEGTTGNFTMPLQGVVGRLMSIEIGKSSWEETEEECEGEFGMLATDLARATIDEPQGGDVPAGEATFDTQYGSRGDAAQGQPPSTTTQAPSRYLAIYTLDRAVRMPQLAEDLNGADVFYDRQLEQHVCRLSPWMNFVRIQADVGEGENLKHIRTIHRVYCGRFEGWRSNLGVVAEGSDYPERGVLIANFASGEESAEEEVATRRLTVGEVVGYFGAVSAGARAWDQ
ncbi:MAG: hypothetical protein MMC23_010120 [Stictis urceolatum]|nr:hypothetical protein [Stictis urceolata]